MQVGSIKRRQSMLHKCVVALLLLVVLEGCFYVTPTSGLEHRENVARYDHYRLYRLNLETDAQVKMLIALEEQSDSYTFYGHARKIGQKLTIMVAAHKIAEITDLVERYNIGHQILTYNYQDKIDDQWKSVKPKDTPATDYGWDHYYHLSTIESWMNQLVDKYPEVSAIELGASYEGRPTKGIKISRKPNNTAVFVEGGIHAREWISPAAATFIINQLLTSSVPAVKDIADNFDWFFVPITNPDGYQYSFEGDRMWRKSKQPYGICRGADLNRNFKAHWNETGSSPNPCWYDFAGSSAESEPEAANIVKFIENHVKTSDIRTYISLHSFSQLVMFPHGYSAEKAANYDDLTHIGKAAVAAIENRHGRKYLSGSIYEIIYPSSGGSKDWAYTTAGIPITFTFELRGPPESDDMFILPADEITPTGEETLDAFVAILTEARKLGYYEDEKRSV